MVRLPTSTAYEGGAVGHTVVVFVFNFAGTQGAHARTSEGAPLTPTDGHPRACGDGGDGSTALICVCEEDWGVGRRPGCAGASSSGVRTSRTPLCFPGQWEGRGEAVEAGECGRCAREGRVGLSYSHRGGRGRCAAARPLLVANVTHDVLRLQGGDKEEGERRLPCWRHSSARGGTAARY